MRTRPCHRVLARNRAVKDCKGGVDLAIENELQCSELWAWCWRITSSDDIIMPLKSTNGGAPRLMYLSIDVIGVVNTANGHIRRSRNPIQAVNAQQRATRPKNRAS